MTANVETCLLARIDVPATESLGGVARRLNLLMSGFVLKEESSGRFDEVPAFLAERDGMEFVLFGVPEGESGDYELKFRCETNLPISAVLAHDAGGFLRQFVRDKPVEHVAFMDFSEELAQLLVSHGIEGCRPIRPTT